MSQSEMPPSDLPGSKQPLPPARSSAKLPKREAEEGLSRSPNLVTGVYKGAGKPAIFEDAHSLPRPEGPAEGTAWPRPQPSLPNCSVRVWRGEPAREAPREAEAVSDLYYQTNLASGVTCQQEECAIRASPRTVRGKYLLPTGSADLTVRGFHSQPEDSSHLCCAHAHTTSSEILEDPCYLCAQAHDIYPSDSFSFDLERLRLHLKLALLSPACLSTVAGLN